MKEVNLKKKAIKGVKWTTLSAILGSLFQFLQISILARLLNSSEFGLISLVTIIINFSQAFLDMGISNAIIHKQDVSKDTLSTLYWLNILSGFFISIVIILMSPFFSDFYNEPKLTNLCIISSVTFIIQPFGQQFMILFQKEMEFKKISIIEIISKLISLFFSVILAYKGFEVYSIVYGNILTALLQTLGFVCIGFNKYKPSFIFKIKEVNFFLKFGLYQTGEKIINFFHSNIDKILIGKFLGSEELGFYSLAWQLVIFPVYKINPIVNKVVFPLYSKVQKELKTLSNYYSESLSSLLLVTAPMFVFIFFYSKPIVDFIYGNSWEKTANLLNILVIIALLRGITNPSGALINSIGRVDFSFWWNFLASISTTIVIYFSITIYKDIIYVSYSLLILSLFSFCIYHYLIHKISKVEYKNIIFNLIKVLIISIIIASFSKMFIVLLNITNLFFSLLTGFIICLLIYTFYLKKYQVKTLNFFLKKN